MTSNTLFFLSELQLNQEPNARGSRINPSCAVRDGEMAKVKIRVFVRFFQAKVRVYDVELVGLQNCYLGFFKF